MYPDFSVLMSLYIKEKASYFNECMKSIMNQTVLPTEIVIVEDGPISEEVDVVLKEYIAKFPNMIRTVSYPQNKGLGYALSVGVRECTYELIARMDTDDIARKDRFEIQLKKFINNPNLGICGSYIDEFENEISNIVARRSVPISHNEIREYQKRRDAFNHMTVMFKKSDVLKVGNYQPCPLMEDTLLWVHMLQAGVQCANIDDSLVYARIGSEMYERRGGWAYFTKYCQGRKLIKESGYISKFDYYYTVAIQLIVALIPGKMRGFIFKKILHK